MFMRSRCRRGFLNGRAVSELIQFFPSFLFLFKTYFARCYCLQFNGEQLHFSIVTFRLRCDVTFGADNKSEFWIRNTIIHARILI